MSATAAQPDAAPQAPPRPSIIERAYQLARSGQCHNVAEIALRLKQERYDSVEAHLAGHSIRKELRRLCAECAS